MTATPLAAQLARQIADYIRSNGLAVGERLPERRLAEQFRVSRSPIKTALGLLERDGMIRREPDKGYVVAAALPAGPGVSPDAEEGPYLRVAEDHLAGHLAGRISENALIRRYGLRRGQVLRILMRAAEEGWAERLPGHGWTFLPVLASARAFEEAYRFRIVIEPAGILENSFRLDRPAMEQVRQHQKALVDGLGYRLSPSALFTAGSHFHEVVMQCSGNAFLVDALTRLNRLRRLIEYRNADDRAGWIRRAREHIELADMLLDGDRAAAADLMRRHLEGGSHAKKFERAEAEGCDRGPLKSPPPRAGGEPMARA